MYVCIYIKCMSLKGGFIDGSNLIYCKILLQGYYRPRNSINPNRDEMKQRDQLANS